MATTNPVTGLPNTDDGTASSVRAVTAQNAALPQPVFGPGQAAAVAAGFNPAAVVQPQVLPNYGAIGKRLAGNVPLNPAVPVVPQPALGQAPVLPTPTSSFPAFQMSAGLGGPSAAPLAAPLSPNVNGGIPLPNGLPATGTIQPPLPGTTLTNNLGANPVGAPLPAGAPVATPGILPLPNVPNFAGAPAAGGQVPGSIEVIRGSNVSYAMPDGTPVPGPNGSGGATGITNPFGAIQSGFDAQQATAQANRQQALDYVNAGTSLFDRATRARAITGIDNATLGPNNQGAVQGQGADALNSAQAGIISSAQNAGASMYDSTVQANAGIVRQGLANEGAARVQKITNQALPVDLGPRYVPNRLIPNAPDLPQEQRAVRLYNDPNSDVPTYVPTNPNTGTAMPKGPAPIEGEVRTVGNQTGVYRNGKWVTQAK